MTVYVTFAGSQFFFPTGLRAVGLIKRTGYSGLMDFVLALLPWSILWHLQMKRREKIGVGIAMSLGIL